MTPSHAGRRSRHPAGDALLSGPDAPRTVRRAPASPRGCGTPRGGERRRPALAAVLAACRSRCQPPTKAPLGDPLLVASAVTPLGTLLAPPLLLQGPPHRHLRVPRCLPRVPGRSVPPATVAPSAASRRRLALQVRPRSPQAAPAGPAVPAVRPARPPRSSAHPGVWPKAGKAGPGHLRPLPCVVGMGTLPLRGCHKGHVVVGRSAPVT